MGAVKELSDQVYRDYVVDGVPTSGAFDPPKVDIRALFDAIDPLASSAGAIVAETWTALALITGTMANQIAYVPTSDAGTHTDPVVGGTVPNSGVFSWSADPAGWLRVAAYPTAGFWRASSEASADGLAYTMSADATWSWSTGNIIQFKCPTTNANASTTTPTISVNGHAAEFLRDVDGGNIPAGKLNANSYYLGVVTGATNMDVLNLDVSLGDQKMWIGTGEASGDGLAYTVTTTESNWTGSVGSTLLFHCPATNNGSATIAINGASAKTLLNSTGLNFLKGELVSGTTYIGYVASVGQFWLLHETDPRVSSLSLHRTSASTYDARLITTSDGTLQIEALVGGTPEIVARVDQGDGMTRFTYGAGIGETIARATPFYSRRNMPDHGLFNTLSDQHRRDFGGMVPRGQVEGFSPIWAVPSYYYVTGGDFEQPIRVLNADTFLDCRYLCSGARVQFYCDLSLTVKLYAGEGTSWRGQSAGTTLALSAGAVGIIHNIGVSEMFLQLLNGTVTAVTSDPPPICDVSFAMAGQSNSVRMMETAGLAGIQERWAELALTDTAYWIQGATNGSTVLKTSQAPGGTNFWWDDDLDVPGPCATNFISVVNAAIALGQPSPSCVIWEQGQGERFAIALGDTTPAAMLSGMASIFAWIRAPAQLDDSTLKFIVVPYGHADETNSEAAVTAEREVHMKITTVDPHCYHGYDVYDLFRYYGNAHLSFWGYREEGRRLVNFLGNLLYSQTNDLAPFVESVTEVDGSTYEVKINTGGYGQLINAVHTQFIDAMGFRFCTNENALDATFYNPNSGQAVASLESGTWYMTITFTLDAPHTGLRLAYPYGGLQDWPTGRFLKGLFNWQPLACYNGMPS